MNIHKNARLAPRGRAELVRRVLLEGRACKRVAEAFGVSERTVAKWVARFKAGGAAARACVLNAERGGTRFGASTVGVEYYPGIAGVWANRSP